MNNITNSSKDQITYNTPISVEPKGVSDIFHGFKGNTIWDSSVHNKGTTTSGYDSILDNSMVPVSEGVKSRKCNTKKKEWTSEEDTILKNYVELHGSKKWKLIASLLGKKDGRQCRERWHHHLRPDIKKGDWSEKEDQILVEAHKECGNKWKQISLKLHGRSENEIKNRWHAANRRMHTMKSKQGDKTAYSYHSNILENYIRHVKVNNDPPKTNEIANIEDGDEDFLDGEINLSMDVTIHTKEAMANASTISGYVPEQAEFSCDFDITELFESLDDTQMLIQG